jgi:hypothetical protein
VLPLFREDSLPISIRQNPISAARDIRTTFSQDEFVALLAASRCRSRSSTSRLTGEGPQTGPAPTRNSRATASSFSLLGKNAAAFMRLPKSKHSCDPAFVTACEAGPCSTCAFALEPVGAFELEFAFVFGLT